MSGPPRCILGMDPGIKGALSFLHTQAPERTSVYDVPIAGGEINVPGLADLIRSYAPDVAFLERAGARPGQGVVSMFNFGRSYGEVRGAIGALQIPLHFVTPQRWKKHFGLTSDKDQSRMLAIRLFPAVADHFKLKKHDGRAEAALIGLYGAQTLHLLGEGSDATH